MKDKLKAAAKRWREVATLNNAVLAVALLVAGGWVWSTVQAIQHNFTLQQRVDSLAEELEVEALQNKTLQLQRAYYNSEQYLELSARERLGLTNPGEKVVVLPPNTVKPTPAPTVPAAASPTLEARSNFAQWLSFLFGKKG